MSCNLNLCKLMRGARWTRVKERAAGYSGRWPLERLSGLIWHPRNATSILFGSVPSNGSSSIGTSRTDNLTQTNADLFAGFYYCVNGFKAVDITFACEKFHITFSSTSRSHLYFGPQGFAFLFILSVLCDILDFIFERVSKAWFALPPCQNQWQQVDNMCH